MANLIKDIFLESIQEDSKSSYETGFRDLDNVCKIRGGNIVLIGGRPAMGKTEFSISILNNLLKANKSVLYLSLDISANLIVNRMLKELAHRNQEQDMTSVLNLYENKSIHIKDNTKINIDDIKREIEENKPNVIFIDYYQMLRLDNELSFLKELKELAVKHELVVFLLSQISRKVEYRNHKMPLLSDIKGSCLLEDFADIVLMLYRESYYNFEDTTKRASVIVSKNTTGYKTYVSLIFDNGHFSNQPNLNF